MMYVMPLMFVFSGVLFRWASSSTVTASLPGPVLLDRQGHMPTPAAYADLLSLARESAYQRWAKPSSRTLRQACRPGRRVRGPRVDELNEHSPEVRSIKQHVIRLPGFHDHRRNHITVYH